MPCFNHAITRAAAPKRAPNPITPVSTARAAPAVDMAEVAATTAELEMVAVGLGAFDVKGTSETELAPGKATEVELGLGAADALSGFRTPSMTWTTPLDTRTSGRITLAEFTKTVPFVTVMVTLPPLTVGRVVFVSIEL